MSSPGAITARPSRSSQVYETLHQIATAESWAPCPAVPSSAGIGLQGIGRQTPSDRIGPGSQGRRASTTLWRIPGFLGNLGMVGVVGLALTPLRSGGRGNN